MPSHKSPDPEPHTTSDFTTTRLQPVNSSFEIISREHIAELASELVRYRHIKTGCEVFSFINDDENKTFAIGFRTPVTNSNGAPHILEHSVLCGSRKYPVKDPFLQMLKSSFNTFLNANTWADRTLYPVASTNEKDFHNLVDVYLDAVLHPRLTPDVLKQEGWHYEVDEGGNLIFSGIVFNEMKGAYSEPNSRLHDVVTQSLFPDTCYRHDSGGDPAEIPTLTWDEFQNFHARLYHPSNAAIFFYGDDNPEERLAIVESFLGEYSAQPVDVAIPLQPRFSAPIRFESSYPSAPLEPGEKRDFVTINWLLGVPGSPEDILGLELLDHILTAPEGAPLKRALLESKLGEGIAFGGLSNSQQEAIFGIGLKNCAASSAEEIETLVISTLEGLVNNGIPSSAVEASLNSFEFALREFNTGSSPRGLKVFYDLVTDWQYGRDPVTQLRYEEPLREIRGRIASGERYFEDLVERYFLRNLHRSVVILRADPDQAAREDAAEKAKLASLQAGMTDADLARIAAEAAHLKAMQEKADTPEAIATLPVLHLSDVDPEVKPVPQERHYLGGVPVYHYPLETRGVAYLNLAFDIEGLPVERLPLVRFYAYLLFKLGTDRESYDQFSERISTKTGGIGGSPSFMHRCDSASPRRMFSVEGKALAGEIPELLSIAEDAFSTIALDQKERVLQLAKQFKTALLNGVRSSGHQVVMGRLGAGYDPLFAAESQCGALQMLDWLTGFIPRIESNWDGVRHDLEGIRDYLFSRENLIVGVTSSRSDFSPHKGRLNSFLDSLPSTPRGGATVLPVPYRGDEALTISSPVNYVGKALPLFEKGYTYSGAMHVVLHHLNTGYLWEKVRVQGGAYGCFSGCSWDNGVFSLASYRDPNLQRTIDVYDEVGNHLRNLDMSREELEKTIIGALKRVLPYQLPEAKGRTAFAYMLNGRSIAERQRTVDELVATTVADLRQAGEMLLDLKEEGRVVVLGDPEKVTADVVPGRTLRVTKIPE